MQMYSCVTVKPNFGDELNGWMWPKLLEEAFDTDNRQIFLGIGSILYDSFPSSALKIVFGAGYGGYTPVPKIDSAWKIYFVRGKLTAKRLSIAPSLAVGDAAILIRSCVGPAPEKIHKVSFMPHWESTLVGDWAAACRVAGIHYLDPCADVPVVLQEIRESELVITEAMHGAIVSDAVRVPWVPIRPISHIHRMKWDDWASALGITLRPVILDASSFPEYLSGRLNSYRVRNFLQNNGSKVLSSIGREHFLERASFRLSQIAAEAPSLSSDSAIQSAHEQMLNKLDDFRRDFPR